MQKKGSSGKAGSAGEIQQRQEKRQRTLASVIVSMNPLQSQLARHRLMLGITNVGFWVLAALSGLWWLPRCSLDTFTPRGCTLVLAGAVVAQAGFDFVGGFVLMPTPGPSFGRFLARWLRGMSVHTLALGAVGGLSAASFRLTGGFVLAVLLATVGLAWARRRLLNVAGGTAVVVGKREGKPVTLAEASDPAFTGGIVGWGKHATSLLPAAWLGELPAKDVAAELHRRRWQIDRGLPFRAMLLILGWNVLGAAAGAFAVGYDGRTVGQALLLHACWMTLWTFGSLLLLPGLSRKGVFAADRAALDGGDDPRAWIERFPGLVGEDGAANGLVQTIFYPVPSARERLQRLARPVLARFVPGNLARNNLYYSWAACTLLGRAVHCNVGRPELWVFPPAA